MKKLSVLLCACVFMGTLASHAACPLQKCTPQAPVKTTCPAAAPCDTPKPACDSCTTSAPCCEEEDSCCEVPEADLIKQESCCWPLSQAELFKKLCLDKCQMQKACALYEKYKNQTRTLKEELKCEQTKLCKMLKECSTEAQIKDQKHKIKSLKQEIKEQWKCYEDELKCLLNKDQMKTYKKLNNEANDKYNELRKNKCCSQNK